MTSTPYEAAVAGASVIKPAEPTTLPKAVRALDAPPGKPVEWAIRDMWPRGELGLLVGDGGAFKSTVALHLAAAIAGGYPVFDRYAVEQRPVLIVSAEDSQDIVLMRMNAIIAGHGWSRTRTLGNTYLLCEDEPSLGSSQWRFHLSAEVERIKPGFIVLDPWAELLGGDENSNTDARPAIKFLRSVGRSVDAAVAIVHHAGKAAPEKRALDRIRGASALPSASRVIWFFDYQETGVAVENIKLSRAPRLQPFVVKRHIEHLPGNRAQWTVARLTVEDKKTFELDRAERFVIEQLRLSPSGQLTTAGLRQLVVDVGRGISRFDLSRALQTLPAKGILSYEPGKQNSKNWFLTPTSERTGPGDAQGNGAPIVEQESATAAVEPDLFAGDSELSGEPTGRHEFGEPTEPTENLPGRLSSQSPSLRSPLKGAVGIGLEATEVGRVDAVGSRPFSEEETQSLLAEVDESLGRLEFDELDVDIEGEAL